MCKGMKSCEGHQGTGATPGIEREVGREGRWRKRERGRVRLAEGGGKDHDKGGSHGMLQMRERKS